MSMANAIVVVDHRNLHIPTATFNARQLCAFRVDIHGVPENVDAVGLTVFKPTGEHFEMLVAQIDDNGDWHLKISPLMFPDVGDAKYEIVGRDEDGDNTPLAQGRIVIAPFATGGIPIPHGDKKPVTEIYDQNGNLHRIVAVNVGTPEDPDWTTQVEV